MNTNYYAMGKPTESQLVAYLEKVLGPERAGIILREAQDAGGTNHPGDSLSRMSRSRFSSL
jgi:hypothetical protein